MPTILDSISATLTESDRAAIKRLVKRDGTVRRTPPPWRTDPAAWAAWQGLRTALGWHGEGATFTLLMLEEEHRAIWDRISSAALEARRNIARRSPATA